MRCFYHGDVDAVAICRSCGHALCHDCCAEVGTVSACRNRCEDEVAALNDINRRNRTILQKTSALYFWIGVIFLSFAGLLTIGGLQTLRSDKPDLDWIYLDGFVVAMGAGMLVFARRFRAK